LLASGYTTGTLYRRFKEAISSPMLTPNNTTSFDRIRPIKIDTTGNVVTQVGVKPDVLSKTDVSVSNLALDITAPIVEATSLTEPATTLGYSDCPLWLTNGTRRIP